MARPARRPRCIAILLAALLAGMATAPAYGGEEPEHRHLVFALALGAGFSPEDARTISDASWSQDQNTSMIAFDGADFLPGGARVNIVNMDIAEFRNTLNHDVVLDAQLYGPYGTLRRIATSAVIHSMVDDPQQARGTAFRPTLDAAFHSYMRQQDEAMRNRAEDPARRHAANLILAGQYIHGFVDSFAHPEDAVSGHALFGHLPDQMVHRSQHYKDAAFWTLKELKLLRGRLETTDERGALFSLNADDQQRAFASRMVDAIVKGYHGEILGEKPGDIAIPGLAATKLGLRYAASIRFPYDEMQFAALLERALNRDPERLHPSFRLRFPGFTKVDFDPQPNGRTQIFYPRLGATGLFVEVEDLLGWFGRQPQYAGLRTVIRANVRDYIRRYPQRLHELRTGLDAVIAALREKQARIRQALAEQEAVRGQRSMLDAHAGLYMPHNNIDPYYLAEQRRLAREAEEARQQAIEEAAATERRRRRAEEREWQGDTGPERKPINLPTLPQILDRL
jgi:hypothetical protein